MVWIFALAFAWVGWTYAGWVLVLVVGGKLVRAGAPGAQAKWPDEVPRPKVSVLIAAHNEEAVIEAKLENTLGLRWPRERLEVLVGSDGSTDATDALVERFLPEGVVLSQAPRGGKAQVLNRLAGRAKGDVFLFTDANTMLAPDALERLCVRLLDPGVGVVSGRLKLTTPEGGDVVEGLYWRYETFTKARESDLGVLVGANGGLYALRASLWRPLRPDTVVDDFVVSMRPLLEGYRAVFEPQAVASEETAPTEAGEWKRRVRIAAGNFQSLRELWPLLVRPTAVSLAFWSHKVLRWLAPLALLALVFSTVGLSVRSGGWRVVLAAEVGFLALALGGRLGLRGRVAAFARYFTSMNAALLVGLLRCLRGTQSAAWQRTARERARRAA